MKFIPYGRQDVSSEDIAAVVETLQSDWLTQGPAVTAFENVVADSVGAAHAVAVNSGTAALHVACLAMGLGKGDWLWTSPNTFVASANCGLYCGAQVDFVDIDPVSYNMSAQALEQKLIDAENKGQLPKIVIPVHFSGQPCDMQAIYALSQKYGFKIIEDASHAIGAAYQDTRSGDCRYSDATVFSFHPVKIVTSGEGGMVTTNDDDLAKKMRLFASHGVTRDSDFMQGESHGPWYYQQVALGYNVRITDIQCALGASQMRRLDAFVARRRELAAQYDEKLAKLPVTLPQQNDFAQSAWHLYVVSVAPGERRQVFEALRAAQIGVNVHYIPVHTQPHYQALGFKAGDFPNAEAYYAGAISLPMYATLTNDEQDYVVQQLANALA